MYRRRSKSPVRVSVSCSYCMGEALRAELTYCASCLAPHHADCFAEHGRCSVHGCGERLTVRPQALNAAPQPAAPAPRGPSQRTIWAALIVTAISLIVGFASWGNLQRREYHWDYVNQCLQQEVDQLNHEVDQLEVRLGEAGPESILAVPISDSLTVPVNELRLQGVLPGTQLRALIQGTALPVGSWVNELGQAPWQIVGIRPGEVQLSREDGSSLELRVGPQPGRLIQPGHAFSIPLGQPPTKSTEQSLREALENHQPGQELSLRRGADGQLQWVLSSPQGGAQ